MKNHLKEKMVTSLSSISGITSFLGGYQVCHNICLGVIALLSLIGITFAGMPLLFLTKLAIPFWTTALILFLISSYFYLKHACISRTLLLLNAGILITAIPFPQLAKYTPIFWTIGGTIIIISVLFFVKEKMR